VLPEHTALLEAKRRLRGLQRRVSRFVGQTLLAYDSARLVSALRRAGIHEGDTVLLHSAFEPQHGFKGSTDDLIDAFLAAVGPSGNLAMVSMPYHSSTLEYLAKGKVFDLRRTPSAMGLISECFRRRPGSKRSLHPTHPVIASGPRAEWLVAGHQDCLCPCGPGTPFDKLLSLGAKAVFLNRPLAYLTFFHFLEDRVARHLDFPIYVEEPFDVPVIDGQGNRWSVRTLVFSRGAIARRRFDVLEGWLLAAELVKRVRVGASHIQVVELAAVADLVDLKAREGQFFYEGRHGPPAQVD
jgi:aminoglycoside 3-N-acetyltransferase